MGKDDIFKVDVKNAFSFFNVDATEAQEVIETFADFKMDGRFINVEVSQKASGRDRSRKKGRNRDGEAHFGKRKETSSKKGKKKDSRSRKTAEAFENAFKKKKKRK